MRRFVIRSVFVLSCAWAASGCAVSTPPVKLYAAVSSPASATIGVTPLVDRRPDAEHRGKSPYLIPLLIWNQRIGDYITSDGAFLDDPAEATTRGVATALSGGRFGPARLLKPTDLSPDDACQDAEVRYVASGELQHLYGTLHQGAYLLLTPIFFAWSFHKSDPHGVAQVRLDVVDCETDEHVYRRTLRSEQLRRGQTLSIAAKAALLDLLDQLQNEIALPPEPIRRERRPRDLEIELD